jgi:hypothetical protein
MPKYKYDLAISFAGEQRELAESLATKLDAAGYSIFYDKFEAAELWGQDLTIALGDVYSREARYCLVILSKEYITKAWTNLERQNALSRFIRDRQNYILCVKVHDVELPGLPSIIAYVALDQYGEEGIYRLLLTRLGDPKHSDQISVLQQSDRDIAGEVIQACFRRAIFTRMASEIKLEAMYSSIGRSLGIVQSLIPRIRNQALQLACLEIVGALDAIERTQLESKVQVSVDLPPEMQAEIDKNKMKIIRLLLEIRRAAKIPMQLPFALQIGHFFSQKEADSPPHRAA